MNIQKNWKELAYRYCINNQLPKECLELIGVIDSIVDNSTPIKYHQIQNAILLLLKGNKGELNILYRAITREVGEKYPEKIKYHRKKMEDRGILTVFKERKLIRLNKR